jgi:hypothetical protein
MIYMISAAIAVLLAVGLMAAYGVMRPQRSREFLVIGATLVVTAIALWVAMLYLVPPGK